MTLQLVYLKASSMEQRFLYLAERYAAAIGFTVSPSLILKVAPLAGWRAETGRIMQERELFWWGGV
jgi:hypothetical protein